MAWPADPLPVVVEIAPGADLTADPATWPWVDVTADVHLVDDEITIEAGRKDWGEHDDGGSCAVTFLNDSGRYSQHNPLGQWYGLLGKDTPLRVRLDLGSDAFTRSVSNGWGTATSGHVWTTSGGVPGDYSTNGSAGVHSLNAVNSSRRTVLPVAISDFDVTVDIVVGVLALGAAIQVGVMGRHVDSSNHYIGEILLNTDQTVQVRLRKQVAGSFTTLVTSAAVGGLTHTVSRVFRLRFQGRGEALRARVWDATLSQPGTWHADTLDADLTGPGDIGARSVLGTGNTNVQPVTVTYDNLQARADLFGGFVPAWQPSTDLAGRDRKVAVVARGPLYRLQPGQAKPPARSPLRRFLAASVPAAYWPLEDGANAQSAASGRPGGRRLVLGSGVMEFESGGPAGSAGFAKVVEATGNFASGTTGVQGVILPAWQAAVWVKGKQTTTGQNEFPPLTVFTDSAGAFAWSVLIGNGNPAGGGTGRVASVLVVDTASAIVGQVDLNGPPSLLDEQWHLLQMVATMSGGIDGVVDLYVDGTLVGSDTMTGVNVGNPFHVRIPASTGVADTEETGVAHVSVHTHATLVTQWQAGQGFPGESASSRLFSLCDEEAVPIEIDGGATELMGPQPVATFLDLLRDCEATDGGILHERPFTLAYRPRETLYNQDPALTLNLAVGAQELADTPVPDASGQRYRNRWTVKRDGGSSATAETPAVTAGTELPYEASADANVATDERLANQAGWRLHVTSSGDPDWPALTLRLDEAPHLLDAWLALQLGDRITAGPPPVDLAGRDIDVLVQGYTLRLGHREFEVKANCSPARPWAVGEWDGARYDTMGSTLTAGVAAGATSLSVATPLGPLWTTAAGEMPFDVMVAGERMTVTAISGAASPQTFTVTRAVNGVAKAQTSGADVRLADPSVWAL